MVLSSKAQQRKIKIQLRRHSSAILKTIIDMGRWSHEHVIVDIIEEILIERDNEANHVKTGELRKSEEALTAGCFLP